MKKDVLIVIVAILLVAGICYGLAEMRPDFPASKSVPFSTTTGKKPLANETIVMRVNGEAVTEREFNAFLTQAPPQMQPFYASPEGRRQLADELVKLKALEQEGERLGLANEPDARMRLEMTRTNIMAGLALRKLVGATDEKRLRAEYEKQRPNLEAVELSHILVAYQGGGVPPRTGKPLAPPAAMAKAISLSVKLKGGGDFAATARAQSDDLNTAKDGGLLGPVSAGSLPPELDAVAMTLQPGQVSDPARSQFGIHIFKAGKRTSQPFESVKEALAARIERVEAEAALTRLTKNAKVDYDPKFFPAVAPGGPGAGNRPPGAVNR